jgi:adenylate cyclase
MGQDEAGTVARIKSLRSEVIEPFAAEHGGRVFKTTGDGFLVDFPSPVEAVEAAVAIQQALATMGAQEPSTALRLRIGINLGDIIIEEDGDVFGDGVNIATRLEQIADPGTIFISSKVHEEVRSKLPYRFDDRGEQRIKNVERPVRVYSVAGSSRVTGDEPKALALPDKPSLAVLPFTNISGDPEQDYFADGIVEDLITALSRVRWFFVIARTSSFTYKGKSVDIRQVGRELGVRYVLEGSVRKAGGRVRISGQLIEAETGRHLWANHFDENLENIFELQDRICESVVGVIEPSLRVAEIRRANAKPTESLDAYDLYLRAIQGFYEPTRENFDKALAQLKRAIQIDPDFATAKGFLALISVAQFSQGWSNAEDKAYAIALARDVLARGRNDPIGLLGAGFAIAGLAAEYEKGLRAVEAALELNPNSSQALYSAGFICCYMCEADKALGYFERSIRLNPLDPEMGYRLAGLGFATVIKREYERALEILAEAVERVPNWAAAYRMRIWALIGLGRVEEARSAAAQLMQLDPTFSISKGSAAVLSDPVLRKEYYDALRTAGVPE